MISLGTAFATLAAAFNLTCTGIETDTSGAPGSPSIQTHVPFTVVLRIDLQNARWCSGTCELTRPIAKTDDNSITLESRQVMAGQVETVLQRQTGRYVRVAGGIGHAVVDMAQCRMSAFSGFPANKF